MKTLFAILVTPFLFSYGEESTKPLKTGQLPELILETPLNSYFRCANN